MASSVWGIPLRKEYNYLDDDKGVTETEVAKLRALRVVTIEDLETKLRQYKHEILAFAREWSRGLPPTGPLTSAVSVYYLAYVLAGKTRDIDTIKRFVLAARTSADEDMARRILNTYQSISDHPS